MLSSPASDAKKDDDNERWGFSSRRKEAIFQHDFHLLPLLQPVLGPNRRTGARANASGHTRETIEM